MRFTRTYSSLLKEEWENLEAPNFLPTYANVQLKYAGHVWISICFYWFVDRVHLKGSRIEGLVIFYVQSGNMTVKCYG